MPSFFRCRQIRRMRLRALPLPAVICLGDLHRVNRIKNCAARGRAAGARCPVNIVVSLREHKELRGTAHLGQDL